MPEIASPNSNTNRDSTWMDKQEDRSSMLAKIMMALGLIATMAAATATPSLAQGVCFEGPGFGVGSRC
jgi:hypothetical protein